MPDQTPSCTAANGVLSATAEPRLGICKADGCSGWRMQQTEDESQRQSETAVWVQQSNNVCVPASCRD